MKKLIVILGFLSIACSNDGNDTPVAVVNKTYTVRIQQVCPEGSQTGYSISKATYNRIDEETGMGQCEFISFKDLSNTSYRGYFRSISAVN